MDSPAPVCPLILGCTANDASIHHFKMPLPLALSVKGSRLVPLKYFIKCINYFSSSLSGVLTLVVRNDIEVHVSGLARLVVNSVFAVRL